MSVNTRQNVGQLADGFDRIFSLTGNWDIAKKSIEAVNTAVTVTGANTDTLAESLAQAQTFGKNLSKPGTSSEVLNKLGAVAPGAGGLQNVAGIFNSIAPMAKLSGMDFDSAVTFIGEISQATKNPEQMREMATQTLKLLTGIKGLTNTKGSLGQLMFDPKTGEKQNPLVVLTKFKTLYDTLTEKKRADIFMSLGADPKTMRDAQIFLESSGLKKGAEFRNSVATSADKYEQQMGEATADAAHQAARLKNLLTDAGEQFARPINKTLANLIKFGMDKANLKDVGGVGLGAAGSAAVITAWYGSKLAKEFGGNIIGKFLGGKASLMGGVAEGAMLSRVGVTSVYVVNFGEMGNALGNSPAGKFQEFIPAEATAAPKAASGIKILGSAAAAWGSSLGASGLASVLGPVALMIGVGYLANQASLKRRLAEQARENSLNGPRSDEEKYNLFSGRQSDIPKFEMPTPNITLYYNDEKKKPSKTVVDGRGRFR